MLIGSDQKKNNPNSKSPVRASLLMTLSDNEFESDQPGLKASKPFNLLGMVRVARSVPILRQ
jgi:hypothetical protein